MIKIFQFLQKKLGTSEAYSTFSTAALKTNVLTCGMSLFSSMEAAFHLGPNYLTNSEIYKNTEFEEFENLFNIAQKLVMEHSEEILDVKWLEYSSPSWTRSVLSHECVGQMEDSKEAIEGWRGQVERLSLYSSYQDVVRRIDGEAIELEWNIFPGFSSLAILQEIQKDLARKNIQPEEFKDRIIFMSMFNDIDWSQRKNNENCISNAEKPWKTQ